MYSRDLLRGLGGPGNRGGSKNEIANVRAAGVTLVKASSKIGAKSGPRKVGIRRGVTYILGPAFGPPSALRALRPRRGRFLEPRGFPAEFV